MLASSRELPGSRRLLRADENHRPLRRLGAARKDTGKGNAAMHPSVCACGASTSPCRGGFFTAVSQRRPCKGSCRRQPTEGCIAARRQRYPTNPGRPLPRIRRGRCSHRPAACPRRRQRGLMQASLPARAAQTSRRRKAPARCRTPPSPSVTPPLAGEAFLRQRSKGAPARGAVGASRLRGASPPGGRDIPQTPAGPCLACVGDDARIVPLPVRGADSAG